MQNIIITNQEKFEQVKAEMKKGEAGNLHILAGFDRTLTKTIINGQKIRSLMSVLRESDIMPQEYNQKAQELFRYYHPTETDSSISREEKKKLMKEWWGKMFDLMISFGFNKNHLQKIIDTELIQFREGALDFFALLQAKSIPLVIMSASGVGEAIGLVFEKAGRLLTNVHIISNTFDWDANGQALSAKEPIIHSLNKDEILVKDFLEIYQEIKNRKNVILLGDNPEDISMIEGFEYENLIKIGFLNEKAEENLEHYKEAFDVVILDDGSMDFVNKLTSEII